MKGHYLIAPAFLTLTACISQNVVPVSAQAGPKKEICVVESPKVQKGFQAELVHQLQTRGYETRVIAPDSPVTACPLTLTYVAHWSWDLAIYLTQADIRVFADGREAGRAVYDSTNAGLDLGKYISAEAKIDELVGKLFPAT
jgi:hypothetical protein